MALVPFTDKAVSVARLPDPREAWDRLKQDEASYKRGVQEQLRLALQLRVSVRDVPADIHGIRQIEAKTGKKRKREAFEGWTKHGEEFAIFEAISETERCIDRLRQWKTVLEERIKARRREMEEEKQREAENMKRVQDRLRSNQADLDWIVSMASRQGLGRE